jgi:predicted amidohydrolase
LSSNPTANEPLPAAVCQMEAGPEVDANLATIERLALGARARGARLALFPEAAVLPIHASVPELEGAAASFASARAQLARIAIRARIAIVAGLFEPCDVAGKVFNTVVAHADDGSDLGAYRKIHLYDAFGTSESDRFAPGPIAPLTFSFRGTRFGVLTCYDLRFPELARALVDDGADALLVPAAWASGPLKEGHWSVLLRARAIENTAFVLAAGQCGDRHAGLSAIIDPLGVTLAGLAEEEGVAVGELRRERLEDARRRLPVLANRRLGRTS